MLDKKRNRLAALGAELEHIRENHTLREERALAELRSMRVQYPELEGKVSQLKQEVSQLEAHRSIQLSQVKALTHEVLQLEAQRSKLLEIPQKTIASILAGDHVFSDILGKPLLSEVECTVCASYETMSVCCRGCRKGTCISCVERNLQIQSKSGSIGDKRKAAALECFSCKGHYDTDCQLFSASTPAASSLVCAQSLPTLTATRAAA
eukprot:TRINITY_DN92008_c0_g1_i1.p1 TRINITY_DN92008_c0_g1~~TRINITY_DN92008_c0_g1_i1.p1  ORF type:complete len:208 (-),score=26.26 TRINITY_DN92008_c0_g1_i1:11-634(-)